VLEAAGVNLDLTPEQIAQCIQEVGVGFMFAPKHHGAMKHAIGPRKEMAVRTIFNVLGPLTNPAGAPNQVIGVFSQELIEPLARVLARLGSRHVLVVHADDGLDEISIAADTHVAEYKDGNLATLRINPQQFGFDTASLSTLTVSSPEESLEVIRSVFDNADGPARDIVALNAGAAIYASGLADDLNSGVGKALASLSGGAARERLSKLVALSNSF
jgi:anthranilate phosphoribosyltransferase